MAEKRKRKKRSRANRQKALTVVLAVVAAAAVGIAVWAVCFRNADPALAPEQAPKTDRNAESLEDDGEGKMDAPEGGGAVSLSYQKDVAVRLSDGSVRLMFENPGRSLNDIVLQLVVTDGETETVIAQSGKLPPGYRLETMELLEDIPELSEGVYEGRFQVICYDPETGEKETVNGNIEDITINVSK